MVDIERAPTELEKDLRPTGTDGNTPGFVPIGRFKNETPKDKFTRELIKHEQEATKKGLPFASAVARDDFEDHYKSQAQASMRAYGYVRSQDIKPIKTDWNKYSDLKNFEVIDEGERTDDYLTKINPGLHVTVKFTKYKFKGYSNRYTVMESGPDAIARAKKK